MTSAEQDERILRWIAVSLGYRLECQWLDSDKEEACWRIVYDPVPAEAHNDFMDRVCTALRIPRVPFGVTLSFLSPTKLLDNILASKAAFMSSYILLPNPFFGMSREELELRMAVAGI